MYRSKASLVTGVGLLIFGAVLALDAVIEGVGRGPWIGAAVILVLGVVTFAVSIRPLVRADSTGLLIRNPFRDITLAWPAIAEINAAYSIEVRTHAVGGQRARRFQMWAVPVSLHARKRANRANNRAGLGGFGGGYADTGAPQRSFADQVVDDLRTWRAELAPDVADAGVQPVAAAGEAAAGADVASPAEGAGVRVAWCWPLLGALGLAAALLVLAILIA